MVIANLLKNVDTAKKIIRRVVSQIPEQRGCACAAALQNSIITAPERIPPAIKKDLALLVGKYVK